MLQLASEHQSATLPSKVIQVPYRLTSHQLRALSREILDRTRDALRQQPLTYPNHLQAQIQDQISDPTLSHMLASLDKTIAQLEQVHTLQKYKSVNDMRRTGKERICQKRQLAYSARRSEMSRLKTGLRWYLMEADQTHHQTSEIAQAAHKIKAMIEKRIKRFERLSYVESTAEFDYFFAAIDQDPEAQWAIERLRFAKIYENMKVAHQRLNDLYTLNNQLKAQRAAQPKLKETVRELRRMLRSLISLLNFHASHSAQGDNTQGINPFQSLLAEIDKAIQRVRSVSDMRETKKMNATASQIETAVPVDL